VVDVVVTHVVEGQDGGHRVTAWALTLARLAA
jgi:hypothetical protein